MFRLLHNKEDPPVRNG